MDQERNFGVQVVSLIKILNQYAVAMKKANSKGEGYQKD